MSLTIIKDSERRRGGRLFALFLCGCGNKKELNVGNVKSGNTKSCGCTRYTANRTTTHGMTMSPTYRSWSHMKERCTNKSCKDYPNYGGRGIKVCDRWLDSFENFLSDMGVKPANTSIDRIDNDGPYCEYNCKWSTRVEQNKNKRSNVHITVDGVTKLLCEWAEHTGINATTISRRIKNGWNVKDAVTKETRKW